PIYYIYILLYLLGCIKFKMWKIMEIKNLYSRRHMLKSTITLAGLISLNPALKTFAIDFKNAYRVSACDWSIGKHSDIGAVELAGSIGLDGVQVSLGNVENKMHLRQKK